MVMKRHESQLRDAAIPPVGASLLAMVVNDNAGSLMPRGVLGLIASMLAPTRNQPPGHHAMVVNDNAGSLAPRGVLDIF
jgi:hypothetical protein